jgi:hypothetical protein
MYEVVQYFLNNYSEVKSILDSDYLAEEYLLLIEIISKMLSTGQTDIQFEELFQLETLTILIERI